MHFSLFRASLVLCCWLTAAFAQIPQQAPASGGIAGIVLDANNFPVRRAIVTLSTVETPPQDAVAWTDANGRFSFSYVPAGRYQLRATKTDYQPAVYGAETARVPPGIIKLAAGESRTEFILHLRGMSSISGVVVDDDGDPLAGVRITAMRLGFRRQKRTLLGGPGTVTDASGRYSMNVFPGRYVVVAARDYRPVLRINPEVDAGHAQQQYSYGTQFYPGTDRADSATIFNIQEAQEVPSIDFRLVARPAVSLRGKVILPLEVKSATTNVSISVTSEGLEGRSNFGMGAGPPDYTFRNDQLASGAYRLVAQASIEGRNYRGVQSIDLGPQGPTDVTIALEPGIDLSGRVSVEGPDAQKYSASFVSLVPGDRVVSNGPLRAGVNKDGSFKITGVPPGVWDIDAGPIPPGGYLKSMRLGDQDVLTEDMTIRPSTTEQLNIVLSTRAAAFEGDVTEGDQPARAVVLLAPEEKFRHVLSFYRLATADDRGHFEIKRATPGRYRLFAFDEFDERSIQDPDFLKPFESLGVPVVLREGANGAQKLSRILSGNPQLPSDVQQPQTAGAALRVQQ
jgi:hypothetical protein